MYKIETFRTGESFHRVACNIIPDDWLDNDNDDAHWFIPSIVNMAFACELYLKSLISDGQSEAYGHNFSELYEQLSNQNKTSIAENPYFKGDDEFQQKLEAAGRVFVEWRYHFDGKYQPQVDLIFLENLAITLHALAENQSKQVILL